MSNIDTEAEAYRVEAIEIIEEALKDMRGDDGPVHVERVYCLASNDFEITVTFPDGSYLSLNTPEPLVHF